NDLCGNASYTKMLADALSAHFQVTVLPVNTNLLREKKGAKARRHIQQLCREIQTFDYVNIQHEAGLFGTDLRAMKNNFAQLAHACKNLIVTMHKYQCRMAYPGLTALGKQIVKGQFSNFVSDFKQAIVNNRYAAIYR